jgi:hypothetical protein
VEKRGRDYCKDSQLKDLLHLINLLSGAERAKKNPAPRHARNGMEGEGNSLF